MKATLNNTLLKTLPPLSDGERRRKICDDLQPGLHAVQTRTSVHFSFRYFDERHRERSLSLGRYGDVTVSQVRQRAREYRAEVSLGRDPQAEKRRRVSELSVAQLLDEHYLPDVRQNLRSAHNTEVYVRRINTAMGSMALGEVTPVTVASFKQTLLATGLSPSTVNLHLAALRSAYNFARKRGLFTGGNPAANPGMAPVPNRTDYLTPVQVQALLKALDLEPCIDAAAAIAVLLLTGGRKNEVLRARWENVSFENHCLTVPAERSKTKKVRRIALSPLAERVLRAQWNRCDGDGNPFVFPSARKPGQPLESLRGPWERAKKIAGIPARIVLHTLRHSFASALATNGVPMSEIGALLGHSRNSSTTARYAHLAPDRLIATASIAATTWGLLPSNEERNS